MLMWFRVENHASLFKDSPPKNTVTVRNRSYEKKKPPGRLRIVCLGSSTTFGAGSSSPEEMNYPRQLERILKERVDCDIEVIENGIVGAPLYMLAVHLKEVVLPLDPHLTLQPEPNRFRPQGAFSASAVVSDALCPVFVQWFPQ